MSTIKTTYHMYDSNGLYTGDVFDNQEEALHKMAIGKSVAYEARESLMINGNAANKRVLFFFSKEMFDDKVERRELVFNINS